MAEQEEQSDLFLFIKYVNPTMFKKFIAIDEEDEGDQEIKELDSVSRAIEEPKQPPSRIKTFSYQFLPS